MASGVLSTSDEVEVRPAPDPTARPDRRPQLLLALAGAAFLLLQLAVLPRPLGFSADEVVYLAKIYPTAPEISWGPSRAWGMPLLAAPPALFDAGVGAIRVYFAVLSSVCLVGAFWPWLRILRPAVAPLAALLFGTTWVTLFFGPAVMPNLYVALGGVAVAGLYVRAVEAPARRRLLAAALVVALLAVIRPTDSVLAVAPVLAVGLGVRRLRRPSAIAALVVGGVVGWLPWIAESYARFGGPLARLSAAETAGPGGLSPDLSFLLVLPRLLDGVPYYFRGGPAAGAGPLQVPFVAWLAVGLAMVVLGFRAGAAQRRLPETAMVTGAAAVVAAFYLLLPAFTSIRFLVPVFALLSLPAAAALVHLVLSGRRPRRRVVAAVVAAGVLGHVAFGIVKADRFLDQSAQARQGDLDRAAALAPLVDGRPCLLASPVPHMAGYQLRCSVVMTVEPGPTAPSKVVEAIRDGSFVFALLDRPPAAGTYLQSWRAVTVPDLPGSTTVYVPD